uniref:Elongation factor Ts, mitochondrial n=1 Tax=Chromera velia CCMP2878 TaxID=1169474 RepID=A0A0G4F4Y4_9ALVE|eukprot:Cvel_2753.t1-p1 / transcript=Cvel_2753.t1 / gene=Cvel_2753 / organism=Chromera_velia_CCMP2878 / gene_product=Elongation factor Ts, putative / transcript_product=Elongation factor Ts, putative / location=Cvel_scaffold110:111670-114456(+) / protein_length=295 / sequence_SO=supercontig / SO=protein_coding / is_pseudo=false
MADIKKIRAKTGAGIAACKKALTEAGGDFAKAEDLLRVQGATTLLKRAGNTASEGLVGVVPHGNGATIFDLNCETDFVEKNDLFRNFAQAVFGAIEKLGNEGAEISVDGVMASPSAQGTGTLNDQLNELGLAVREKIELSRVETFTKEDGHHVFWHVENNRGSKLMGKQAVVCKVASTGDGSKLQKDFAEAFAVHCICTGPIAVTRDRIPKDAIDREQNIQMEIVKQSGKPEEMIEKIVGGKMNKWFKEKTLMDQVWVCDDTNRTVQKVFDTDVKEMVGAPVTVEDFRCWKIGES